ncbi:uncharacterized protein LOC134062463 [Sardina pilchardus]|uniref:uncharacterized protein LOC134062044 n=1 Tax=Sardina pilchardus TaxID=27697 RepID=UPI002E0D3E11
MAEHWQMSRFVEDFKSTVLPSLKSGLDGFNGLTSTLLATNTDIVTMKMDSFRTLRSSIEKVKKNLSQSEEAASTRLRQVDKLTENLTAKKGDLERKQSDKNQRLNNLKTKLKSDRAVLEMHEHSLSKAINHMRETQWKLQDLQSKKEKAEEMRDIGIGLAFIPIVGWIPGGIMIGVGQADLDQASWAAEQAKQEVDAFESQISTIFGKLSSCEKQIGQVRGEMSQVSADLERLRQDLKTVKNQRTTVASFQSKMRSAVSLLGQLAGTASVAEVQTRVLVLLGPVISVLENVIDLAGQVTQQSLLSDRHLRALIVTLQQNHHRLRAIEANKSADQDNDFY